MNSEIWDRCEFDLGSMWDQKWTQNRETVVRERTGGRKSAVQSNIFSENNHFVETHRGWPGGGPGVHRGCSLASEAAMHNYMLRACSKPFKEKPLTLPRLADALHTFKQGFRIETAEGEGEEEGYGDEF